MAAEGTQQLEKSFNDLVLDWNKKINLVSRKKTDIYDLIEDSRIFLNYIDFVPGLRVLDLGTGAGIPGIVIRIHHPEIKLTLIDSINKKVKAVEDIVNRLGFKNVEVICARAEELGKEILYRGKYDYIVARSVAELNDLVKWSKNLVKPGGRLVTVKGGDISKELGKAERIKYVENMRITDFPGKCVVEVSFS